MKSKRLTPAQRKLLEMVGREPHERRVDDYCNLSLLVPGKAGRSELVLSRLATLGYVRWDGSLDECELTELGKSTLEKIRRRKKS